LPTVKMGSELITMTLQATVGSWKLYTGVIANPTNSNLINSTSFPITITGTSGGNKIDELRLYPQTASMTTTSYEPLFGPSSTCDERNNITYYQYDAMGRLKVTTDINGNILSITKHVIQGNDN